MTRRVLLVEIGSDNAALSAVTPVIASNASWVPAVYVPPPLPPPTGLVVLEIADAAQLNWIPAAVADAETVIESAPDDAGAPGAWAQEARTGSSNYLLALPSGPRWVRLKTIRYQNVSAPTAAVLATPVDVDQAIADAAAAKAAADLAKEQADFANDAIDVIRADGILDAGEKPNVMRLHQIMSVQVNNIQDQADRYGISRVGHDAALNALNVFLGGLTPPWNDTATDTPINRITFDDEWENYYNEREILMQAIVSTAKTLADAAQNSADDAQADANAAWDAAEDAQVDATFSITAINVIKDDGVLDASEKPDVMRLHQTISETIGEVRASGDAYGVSRTALDAAKSSLDAYLGSLSPAWNSTTTDTPINRTTFNDKFAAYYAARQALLTAIAAAAQAGLTGGRNLLQNAGWETDLQHWGLYGNAAGGFLARDAPSLNWVLPGTHCVVIRNAGATVYGQYTDARSEPVADYPVIIGQHYIFSVFAAASRCTATAFLQWIDAAGAEAAPSQRLGNVTDGGGDTWADHQQLFIKATAPVGAVRGRVVLRSYMIGEANTYAWFTHPMAELVSAAQTRPSPWDAGVNGLEPISRSGGGLQNPGSGNRLGDGRNLPMVNVGNVAAQWSGMSVSYSTTTTSATLTASAAVLHEGGVAIAYNQASVTVSGSAGSTVTYYLYYDDPTHAGGSRVLNSTTSSLSAASSNGRLRVAPVTITYPTSGTGGGTFNPPPNYCVSVDAWVIRRWGSRWEFARAGDVRVGDELRVIDPVTGAERWGRVSKSFATWSAGVLVETEGGGALACSYGAPLGTDDGQVLAPEAVGARIAERRLGWLHLLLMHVPGLRWLGARLGTGRFGHHRCHSAADQGVFLVQAITCENGFFLAGRRKRRLLAHHNIKTMEP